MGIASFRPIETKLRKEDMDNFDVNAEKGVRFTVGTINVRVRKMSGHGGSDWKLNLGRRLGTLRKGNEHRVPSCS